MMLKIKWASWTDWNDHSLRAANAQFNWWAISVANCAHAFWSSPHPLWLSQQMAHCGWEGSSTSPSFQEALRWWIQCPHDSGWMGWFGVLQHFWHLWAFLLHFLPHGGSSKPWVWWQDFLVLFQWMPWWSNCRTWLLVLSSWHALHEVHSHMHITLKLKKPSLSMKKNDLGLWRNAWPKVAAYSYLLRLFSSVSSLLSLTVTCLNEKLNWSRDCVEALISRPRFSWHLMTSSLSVMMQSSWNQWVMCSMGFWIIFGSAALMILLLLLCPLHDVLKHVDCKMEFSHNSSNAFPILFFPNNDALNSSLILTCFCGLFSFFHIDTSKTQSHNNKKHLSSNSPQVMKCMHSCCVIVQWHQIKLAWWWKVLKNCEITDSHGTNCNWSNLPWRSTLSSKTHSPSLSIQSEVRQKPDNQSNMCFHPSFPTLRLLHTITTFSTILNSIPLKFTKPCMDKGFRADWKWVWFKF